MRALAERRSIVSGCLVICAMLVPRGATAGRAAEVRVESFEMLNEGVSAYNRGDYDLAVEKLRSTAAIALNSFRAHYYLGLALNASRQYEEAVEALNVALDLDPNHLQSLVALGDAQLKMGDIEEAQAGYFRALKLRAAFAPALDGLARSYESQAKNDKAIDHYRQAILSNKGFAPAYTHLGDLYLRLDRLEEAVGLLEEAVSIRPDYAPGMNRLALAYGRLGLGIEAVATIQKAIELEPESPYHPATLGRLQLDQGLTGGAERSFLRALELAPDLPEGRMGLAEVARRRGQYDLALEQIDAALGVERPDPFLVVQLRETRAELEKEQLAVAELLARVETGEPSPDDFAALAAIYARRGLWEEAIDLERRAPVTPERQERVAYMLFQAGRFREAQTIYAELLSETDRVELQVNQGVTLAMLGDDAAAEESYDRILQSHPHNALATLYLGNALLRLGRDREAAEAYKRFLDRNGTGEAAERVRRILRQIAPDLLPPPAEDPLAAPPPPPVAADPGESGEDKAGR